MMRIVENESLGGARSVKQRGTRLVAWWRAWLRGRDADSLFGRRRGSRRMQLVEVLSLGGRRQLMMVQCDGQRYLVGAGADGVQTIAAMSAVGSEAASVPVVEIDAVRRGLAGQEPVL